MRRGFTLVELMVVVVLIGVMAALAAVSFRHVRSQDGVDRFAEEVRDAVAVARRRAVATGSTYIVHVRPTSVAFCQKDPNNAAQTSCPTAANAVCGSGLPCENGRQLGAGPDATALQTANAADLGQGPAKTNVPAAGKALYLLRNGTADSDIATSIADGFTVYLRGTNDTSRHVKVVVYPAAGRPRLIDTW